MRTVGKGAFDQIDIVIVGDTITDGTQIELINSTYGTVDNTYTVVTLHRCLTDGWSELTVNTALADVDGNGTLSLRDCTLLSRYLAGGWGVRLK